MLLYFFRKKVAFCNYCGLYTILGLYVVTFVRMVFPFEFKFTYTVSDKNVYAAIMDVLTPNKDVLFVPEFTWLNLLVAVWIAGSVIYISRVMIKYYKAVKALKANVIDGTPEMQAKLDLISQKCGIRRKVKLKITDCVISPVTYGFFNLVILIPNREFDDRDFGYIATHECCHIKNKDIWIKLLTEIYCGIFWWNPFAHLLKKDLTYCLELRCDKRVTSKLSENRCTVYYEVLVTQMKAYKEQKESEKSDRETALKSALVGMSFVTNDKGEKIISRMEMILYPKKKQTIINNVVTALMALLVVAIFFASYCFLIVPGWDATYEDCVADLIESGEYNDNVEVYDETNMYVYVEKDKTTHLIFEPYDEKKGIVYTDDNSIIIPYEQVENGEYSYCLVLKEKCQMKKKAAKIFTAFIMTAIIAQGTVMVASAAETDSTPDSVIVIETATPDSSFLESGADSTAIQPRADVIVRKWRRGSRGQLQYRRWNDTKQEWVDDEWIDYKG